jgi:hypothetical protein
MKKIITTIAIFTAFSLAHADENVINVSSIKYEGGKTVASFSREVSKYNVYTDSFQSYSVGAFTKVFNGTLTQPQVVDKATRYVDDYIFVQSGNYKKTGQNYKLAEERKKAFFANGYSGYFGELAKQLIDEK